MTASADRPDAAAFTRSVFCGRDKEMSELKEAFRRLLRAEPEPEIVVLLAESGLGKSRLAQEFYHWLSTSMDGAGDDAYWPAHLDQLGDNLRINPEPSACNNQAPLPFLWWGVRLVDPGGRNQAATSALAAGIPCLTPHLHPFALARRRTERRLQGADSTAELALNLTPLGPLKAAGDYVFELMRLGREELQDRAPRSIEDLDRQGRATVVDALVHDLDFLFGRAGDDRVPLVLLVDDAQFSAADPDVSEVIDRLIAAAFRRRWPCLILITHWEAEWYTQSQEDSRNTIAQVVTRHRQLYRDGWRPIPLGRVEDLDPMLRQALPGVTVDQERCLLARADGNPLLLDEMMRLALASPRLFSDLDVRSTLTPDGLAWLLEEPVAPRSLVAKRLRSAPETVRRALALGSLNGMEFLRDLVTTLGRELGWGDLTGGLAAAESHAMIRGAQLEVVSFAQGIFHEVAREHLEDLVNPEQATHALREVIRQWIEVDEEWNRLGAEPRLRVLSLTRAHELLPTVDPLILWTRVDDQVARLARGGLHRQAADVASMALSGRPPTDLRDLSGNQVHDATVALASMANFLVQVSDHQGADELCGMAMDLSDELKDQLGGEWTPEHEHVLAATQLIRGRARLVGGDHAGGVADHGRAILRLEAMCAEATAPGDRSHHLGLARAHVNRGFAYKTQGRWAESISDYDEAIRLLKALQASVENGLEEELLTSLALAHLDRALSRRALSRLSEAEADVEASFALWDEVRGDNQAQRTSDDEHNIALTHMERGLLHSARGNDDEALRDYNTGIGLLTDMKANLGEAWTAPFERTLALLHRNRGNLYRALSEPERAVRDLNTSVQLSEDLRAQLDAGWTPRDEDNLAAVTMNRGSVRALLGELEEALGDYTAAITMWTRLKESYPLAWTDEYQYNLAAAAHNRGILEFQQGTLPQAIADFSLGISLREALKAGPSQDPIATEEYGLANGYLLRSRVLYRQGDTVAAVADLNRGVPLLEAAKLALGAEWTDQKEAGLREAKQAIAVLS